MIKFKLPEPLRRSDILFVSLSGSHAYGISRPDSDIDLRGVYIPPLKNIISVNKNWKKTYSYNHLTDIIDLEVKSLPNYIKLLANGNCNCLENLFQEKIYVKDLLLIEDLKNMVLERGLSKKMYHSFKGFSYSQEIDFFKKRKIKCLLYVFRLLAEGIYLFETGYFDMNIHSLYNYIDSELLDIIIANYDLEKSITTLPILNEIEKELIYLKDRLKTAKDNSDLPEIPDYELYNDWLYNFYVP